MLSSGSCWSKEEIVIRVGGGGGTVGAVMGGGGGVNVFDAGFVEIFNW